MNKIHHGDCLEVMRGMAPECVDMCVTSPPYWGLRDYGIPGQLGLEKTPEEYIEKLVAIFREVRRVLRPWGTVWLNLGDSYANANRSTQKAQGFDGNEAKYGRIINGARTRIKGHPTLKDKDLCMMPARVALALQADGWWLRSDIIWAKPNPMPESVTDRPTSSYEHIFLLTKSAKYFFDGEAVREPVKPWNRGKMAAPKLHPGRIKFGARLQNTKQYDEIKGANLRNVWTITTQAYPEAHYATFPEELPRRCILAGTSAKGNCAECGKPWVRMVEKTKQNVRKTQDKGKVAVVLEAEDERRVMPRARTGEEFLWATKTTGWQPSCDCGPPCPHPAVVLDPFFGSGTVGVVAEKLQRNWIGIEISREYIEGQAKKRTGLSTSEELMKDKPLFQKETK